MPGIEPVRQTHFIGAVARAAGVSVHTVRFYECLGLLPVAQRTETGYRVYEQPVIERVRFIREAQALGFSLAEIKEILRMKYAGQSPCRCVRGLLEKRLEQMERQIASLVRFRRELRQTLKKARRLPRLAHNASAICPIIESAQGSTSSGYHRHRS